MEQINIHEFVGYSEEQFFSFLESDDKDETYELVFKKESVLFYSESALISWEFGFATYIGQRLSEISQFIGYSGPSLDKQGYFVFSFKARNKMKLAQFLNFISGVFGNDDNSDIFDINSEFEDMLTQLTIEQAVCPDFFENYIIYKKEAEDQRDLDDE